MPNVPDLIDFLSPTERLDRLRSADEDQWFDRKSARISARSLAETLVAFANAEGGLVVIGLSSGVPADVAADSKAASRWRQAGIDHADPPVRTDVRTLDWADASGRTGSFILIRVPPSEGIHATTKDDVFLRIGDENRKLSFAQRRELLFDKGQSQYDSTTPSDWTVDHLHWEGVEQYAHDLGAVDTDRLLVARGLMTSDRRVTVAGMLVFGRAPEDWFPSAHLRIVRYRGTERGTGARLQVVQDERVDGRIPHQVSQAATVIDRLIPSRQALQRSGRFGQVPLIPRDAWLEGVVNAAVHRSYSNFGDHTRIEIFDDRLEIESPGRFPGLADPNHPLSVTRFARNPRIARVSAELGFGREFGEGIRRMFDEMRLAGLADPEYHQTSGSVRLALTTRPVEFALESQLAPAAYEIARLLRDAGRLGTGEIMKVTGRSRPWVIEQLRILVDAGVIEWVGKSSSDPRAYWRRRVD